jgi:hypothetical protein
MRSISFFITTLTLLLLSGCSSVLDFGQQNIRVIATSVGQSTPAQSILENKKGFCQVNARGAVNVERDTSGLRAQCQSPYLKGGTSQLRATPNNHLIGNALLGGVVGVGLDVINGKGFSYSQAIKVTYA